MVRRIVLTAILATVFAGGVSAQPADGVETDPIRCWWKTDRTAVHIGERFGLTLTCGVVDTPSVKVVPTTTQIDPGAIQLAPFEVVGGARHEDVVAGQRRYIQYDYSLRLLGEGFFGNDVSIPALSVTYNVQAAAGNGAQGRDRQYILPPLQMRALSIVPKAAADIRDASSETFAAVEARRFRATTAFVIAAIFFGFAGVLALLATVRVLGRARGRKQAADRPLPTPVVLSGCLSTLRAVRGEVMQEGWTPALARRALATLRIAAAVALGRPVAQSIGSRQVESRDGQIALRRGVMRPKRALVSAAITAHTVERHLGNGASARERAQLEKIRESLLAFTSAGYARNGDLDAIALNGALEEGTEAIKRLRVRSLVPSWIGALRA